VKHIATAMTTALVVLATTLSVADDRFVPLFDGKTLDGWTQRNGLATYRVEDGAVVGKTAKNSPNSFLCTEKAFCDFELVFEVQVDPGLNSGVQIRSRSSKDYNNERVHGPQVEIETAPGESGFIYGEATGRGWVSPNQDIKDAYKNGQWNEFRVLAVGPRIQTFINGKAVENLTDEAWSRCGFIGLQVHGVGDRGPFEVRWRNIKIKDLAPEKSRSAQNVQFTPAPDIKQKKKK
jgi:3-keto-disaccharide hydrolase